MSEGDVENVSGYEVLPKEVLAEVGSVKLFSTYNPHTTNTHPSKHQIYKISNINHGEI